MEKISKIINNEKEETKISEEEYDNLKLKAYNQQIGTLKYYDCDKCKNKGVIYFFDKDTIFNNKIIRSKKCDCMKIRQTLKNLANCGIEQNMFDRYNFDNFETNEEWQVKMKQKCLDYVDKIKNNKEDYYNWLVLSGITGAGKTMMCTSIFKELIMFGFSGKYFLWKDEIRKLKQLKKSSYSDNIEKYDEIMKEIKEIDVLYIDDFMKLTDRQELENDLNLAYEIINSRYINNKITIISTEFSKDELSKMDMALFGRINEKASGNYISLAYDENRNYRLKKQK